MSKQDKPTENGEQTKTQKTEAEIAEEKKNAAIKRRLGKKADKAAEEAEIERKRVEALAEENRILKEKLNPAPAQKPTLADYGDNIEGYEKDLNRYYQGQSAQEVKKGVQAGVQQERENQAIESNNARTQKRIDDHYDKAAEANIEGYDQAEANALEWLGEAIVEGIINVTDNAHEVLHLLGSNRDEANKLLETLQEDNVRGTAAIGRLSARAAKFERKENSGFDPENIPSGGNLPVSDAALKRQHDKLVEDCSNGTGDMKELTKVRSLMREKGLIT